MALLPLILVEVIWEGFPEFAFMSAYSVLEDPAAEDWGSDGGWFRTVPTSNASAVSVATAGVNGVVADSTEPSLDSPGTEIDWNKTNVLQTVFRRSRAKNLRNWQLLVTTCKLGEVIRQDWATKGSYWISCWLWIKVLEGGSSSSL